VGDQWNAAAMVEPIKVNRSLKRLREISGARQPGESMLKAVGVPAKARRCPPRKRERSRLAVRPLDPSESTGQGGRVT
jgi:hypothetical protein